MYLTVLYSYYLIVVSLNNFGVSHIIIKLYTDRSVRAKFFNKQRLNFCNHLFHNLDYLLFSYPIRTNSSEQGKVGRTEYQHSFIYYEIFKQSIYRQWLTNIFLVN